MNSWIDLNALWKIIVIGLLAGAGLPMLFAVGLRALALPARPSTGSSSTDHSDQIYGGNLLGAVLAVVCFAIVLAAIGWGIDSVVEGS